MFCAARAHRVGKKGDAVFDQGDAFDLQVAVRAWHAASELVVTLSRAWHAALSPAITLRAAKGLTAVHIRRSSRKQEVQTAMAMAELGANGVISAQLIN